jgi:hypothetical protein
MKVPGHDAASSWHNEARKGGSNGSGGKGLGFQFHVKHVQDP